jgi:NAD(P)H-dependent FMN reductase
MHKIAVIYGSDREGRFCDVVAGWVLAELAQQHDVQVDVLDPLQLELPRRFGTGSAAVQRLRDRLDAADAFLVITPEYNRSFPAALKSIIDSASEPWQAKPVAFVSYGGISGGLRAVEQLRLVFAELHAVTVRDAVSFSNAWDRFEGGRPVDAAQAARALRVMMARLKWWSAALRTARRQAPYAAAAA